MATLSTTISDEFYKIFTSRFAIISLYDMDGRAFSELRNFFKDKTEKHKVFINDIVFIDRYKSKFDSQKLIKQLPK